jgi:hypothetical protein
MTVVLTRSPSWHDNVTTTVDRVTGRPPASESRRVLVTERSGSGHGQRPEALAVC